MLKENIVLSAKNISKKYDGNKSGFLGKENTDTEFYALKNVSFDLESGKILGIIGSNGAGKSTLLRILSEIIAPTAGSIEYTGTILSILDLGTGFHPDLSGYDNIFFNASLLGMKKKQITEKVPEIVEFSGIGDFIHQPIKNYSSGMYLRLALSIALFTDNEIILLDEIISTGDAEFRHKAVQKIKELTQKGRACIIISHDLNSVLSLCDYCLFLEKGEVVFSGKSHEVVETYLEQINKNISRKQVPQLDCAQCKFIELNSLKESYTMNEAVTFKIRYEKKVQDDIDIVLEIRNLTSLVMSDCEIYRPYYQFKQLIPGIYETECTIPPNLLNAGNYFIDLIFGNKVSSLLHISGAGRIVIVLPEWEKEKKWNESVDNIPFRPQCEWETKKIV